MRFWTFVLVMGVLTLGCNKQVSVERSSDSKDSARSEAEAKGGAVGREYARSDAKYDAEKKSADMASPADAGPPMVPFEMTAGSEIPEIPQMPPPDDAADTDGEFNTEAYDRIVDNPFLAARDNPLSTFSIDVDTASYANVRRYINGGGLPPKFDGMLCTKTLDRDMKRGEPYRL